MHRAPLLIFFCLLTIFPLLSRSVLEDNMVTISKNKLPDEANYTAVVSALPDTICEGDTLRLYFSIFSMFPPYEVTLMTQNAETFTITVPVSGIYIELNPEVNTTYTIMKVVDANGVEGMPGDDAVVIVNPKPQPAIEGDLIVCPGDTLMLDAGDGYQTYSWGGGQTTQNLTIGNTEGFNPITEFTVTVTNNFGCAGSDTVSAIISGLELIECTQVISADSGESEDGAVELHISGGIFPVTAHYATSTTTGSYEFTNSGQRFTIPGLGAGDYSLTLTDDVGCMVNCPFQIDSCQLLIRELSNGPVSCNGNMDGTIQVAIDGGTPPLVYHWSNDSITDSTDVDSLFAGSYMLTVEDFFKCRDSIELIVTEPDLLSLDLAIIPDTCDRSVGLISANVNGGTAPYSFSWSNGGDGEIINSLPSGQYQLTVTDSQGCEFITEELSIISVGGTFDFSLSADSVSCNGGNDGRVQIVNLPNGINNINWDIDDFDGQSQAVNLSADTYFVTIIDDFGCELTKSIVVAEPDSLSLAFTVVPDTCEMEVGAIQASAAGGTPGYYFSWNNGLEGDSINGLAAGIYQVTITDSKTCELVSDSVVVGATGSFDFSLSVNHVSCYGETDGSIQVIGLPDSVNNISWNVDSLNGLFSVSGLTAGNYAVTIIDNLGCENIKSTVIEQPDSISLDIVVTSDTCQLNMGSINVEASGGSPGYDFLWNNGFEGGFNTGLGAGSYQVTVTDTLACEIISEEITVASVGGGFTFGLDASDVSCNGANDGIVQIVDFPNNVEIDWSVDTYDGLFEADNLLPGTYSVTIVDNFDCAVTNSVIVGEPEALSLNFSIEPVSCLTELGTIHAEVLGGTPPYSFSWSDGQIDSVLLEVPPGIYVLTVTDVEECSIEDFVILEQEDTETVFTENDTIEVAVGESRIFDALANDSLPIAQTIEILNVSLFATVDILNDGEFQYLIDLSGIAQDSFQYVVCNAACETDCDTSWVFLNIEDLQPPETVVFGNPPLTAGRPDGKHDVLDFGEELLDFPVREIWIYDVRGNLVFTSPAYNNDWDGKKDGEPLPDGTYYYKIHLGEGRYEGGHITLLNSQ